MPAACRDSGNPGGDARNCAADHNQVTNSGKVTTPARMQDVQQRKDGGDEECFQVLAILPKVYCAASSRKRESNLSSSPYRLGRHRPCHLTISFARPSWKRDKPALDLLFGGSLPLTYAFFRSSSPVIRTLDLREE